MVVSIMQSLEHQGGIVSNLVKATYKFWNQKLTRLNYARLEYWSLRYNSL